MDDAIKPAGSSSMRGRRFWIEPFGEETAGAVG
jgi:hypothetical protein